MRRELTFDEASAIQHALNEKAQARLTEDGHFGTLSQQALMRFQAEHNISPVDGNPSQPTLDALGIPNLFAPPPASPSLLQNWLIGLAIKQAVSVLKGSIPMNFLSGYKTYIIAVLMLLLAVAGLLGWTIPGVNSDPGTLIISALGLITGRTGAKNDVSKALGN